MHTLPLMSVRARCRSQKLNFSDWFAEKLVRQVRQVRQPIQLDYYNIFFKKLLFYKFILLQCLHFRDIYVTR